MRVVAPLVPVKVARLIITAVLFLKTFLAGPGFDQRAIHREVFIRHIPPRLFPHALEKHSRHFLIQQPLAILAEHRVIPHRFVHFHAHEPAEQQVVVELLHQHPLAADRIKHLQ